MIISSLFADVMHLTLKSHYVINKFYVEVVYDTKNNKIIGVESFKTGKYLEKYFPNIKTEY